MIAILMKVFKNLFGNGSKIHAGEIVGKDAAGQVVGLDMAVAEVGQNANGSYVRWNNGLQVCWHTITVSSLDIDDLNAGIYRSVSHNPSYPKEFSNVPVGGAFQRNPGNFGAHVAGGCRGDYWEWRAWRGTSGSGVNVSAVQLIAIGWWKEPGT